MRGPYLPFDYPDNASPLDIDQPFTIGRSTRDGCAVQLDLSQGGGFLVGARGGGGTTLLQNVAASLARMNNTLIWMIDLNNGGLAAPWGLDEDDNVVDWFATTEVEALRMVQAAVRVAKSRRSRYAGEMLRHNETMLSVWNDRPQIVILVEKETALEASSEVGQRITATLNELDRIGRAMRVVVVTAHLRGTADLIPASRMRTAGFKLAGRVVDASELLYLFDKGTAGMEPEQVGQFLIEDTEGLDRFDAYRIRIPQIRKIAEQVREHRANTRLEQASEPAAGADYLHRWMQPDTVQWLKHLRGEGTPAPGARKPAGIEIPERIETLDDVIVAVKALLRRAKKNDEG